MVDMKHLTTGLVLLNLLPQFCAALDVSSYGTIAAGHLNNDSASLINYRDHWSARSETMLGLQLTGNLTESTSLTSQFIIEGFSYQDRDDFEPRVDWLFLAHQFSHRTRLRVGRLRTPIYFDSDILNIGYAYPWVRPPMEVYIPEVTVITNFDGVDLTLNQTYDTGDLRTTFYLGSSEGQWRDNIVSADALVGATLSWNTIDTTLRYSLAVVHGDIQSASFSLLEQPYR